MSQYYYYDWLLKLTKISNSLNLKFSPPLPTEFCSFKKLSFFIPNLFFFNHFFRPGIFFNLDTHLISNLGHPKQKRNVVVKRFYYQEALSLTLPVYFTSSLLQTFSCRSKPLLLYQYFQSPWNPKSLASIEYIDMFYQPICLSTTTESPIAHRLRTSGTNAYYPPYPIASHPPRHRSKPSLTQITMQWLGTFTQKMEKLLVQMVVLVRQGRILPT